MNNHIQKWRASLEQAEHIGPEQMAELESHLIDEIQHLNSPLLSDQEKVLVASHRLGSPATLNKAYKSQKIFNFQRISMIAQVLLGVISFLAIARASLFISLSIQKAFGWTDSLSMVILYYSFQAISAVAFFLLIRHWLRLSIRSKKTLRANFYAFITAIISYATVLLGFSLADLSGMMQMPLFISAFSTVLLFVFLIGFVVTTLWAWFKQRQRKKLITA